MRKLAIATTLLLAGCSGMSYALQEYRDVQRVDWQNAVGVDYRIYDRPMDNRMMITPSIGQAALGGMSFGLANQPSFVFRSAADEWLREQGRNCVVDRIELIVQPQWEAFYNCR